MNDSHKYAARGVSATKDDVHQAIKYLDKGLYEKAFCKVLPDLVANDPDWCNIMHADTAGTKGSLAYMYWKETNDLSVWRGIAQDAIVMNVDDMACVGAVDNIILSSTIGRNASVIPGEVISEIINACTDFISKMKEFDINIELAGGETADVGDVVRTIDVGYTTFARLPRKNLVVNNIRNGQVIVAFASYGKSVYEDAYNGGTGSNGLTSARHDVFSKVYADKYPESYDHHIAQDLVYAGSQLLTDPSPVEGVDVGKLVLSPTRTYLPLIKLALDKYRDNIHGMIHCSGGAQTKVMKFVENVKIVKDQLLDVPPLFSLIQEESKTSWKEMFQVFNMGHRLEMYVDENAAQGLIDISKQLGIDAQVIGHVEKFDGELLELVHEGNKYIYDQF
jgi:phosphoribosylformylglycinamidine cyclo-ligase